MEFKKIYNLHRIQFSSDSGIMCKGELHTLLEGDIILTIWSFFSILLSWIDCCLHFENVSRWLPVSIIWKTFNFVTLELQFREIRLENFLITTCCTGRIVEFGFNVHNQWWCACNSYCFSCMLSKSIIGTVNNQAKIVKGIIN